MTQHMIRIESDIVYETIRRLAFDTRRTQGDVIADALACYLAQDGERVLSATERAADKFTAQVLDTQESDRP